VAHVCIFYVLFYPSIRPSVHGWLHVSTLDIQWYICTSISCSPRGIMPLHCCQRPSSWRKQGQAQGRVKVSFFIWMHIPCTLGSQFLYVLCLIILISFTMFQSWLSVTAQLQTSRFNSKLSTWAESCAKWPLWRNVTHLHHVTGQAHSYLSQSCSRKVPEYGLYHVASCCMIP